MANRRSVDRFKRIIYVIYILHYIDSKCEFTDELSHSTDIIYVSIINKHVCNCMPFLFGYFLNFCQQSLRTERVTCKRQKFDLRIYRVLHSLATLRIYRAH